VTAFTDMTAVAFADPVLAESAVYTPPAGSPVVVGVIVRTVDEALEVLGPQAAQSPGRLFEVGVHEIAAPVPGAALVHDGITYVVRHVAYGPHRLWAQLLVNET
jgi:hypothetical protein